MCRCTDFQLRNCVNSSKRFQKSSSSASLAAPPRRAPFVQRLRATAQRYFRTSKRVGPSGFAKDSDRVCRRGRRGLGADEREADRGGQRRQRRHRRGHHPGDLARRTKPGEKVLITNLYNRVQPFLRYEAEDVVTAGLNGSINCRRKQAGWDDRILENVLFGRQSKVRCVDPGSLPTPEASPRRPRSSAPKSE